MFSKAAINEKSTAKKVFKIAATTALFALVFLFIISLLFAFALFAFYGFDNEDKLCIENQTTPKVLFCPRDNCSAALFSFLSHSLSADCAFYSITDKRIISFLNSSDKNFRFVMDNSMQQKLASLNPMLKNRIHYDNNNQLMHNKFCIFNNSVVLTGSYNPTFNGNARNNNNIIIIKSRCLSRNYNSEFDMLWRKTAKTASKRSSKPDIKASTIIHKAIIGNTTVENYFCPEDNCRSHILDKLLSANKSIYFMFFSFTDKAIADAIISKSHSDIDIKGIIEKNRASIRYNLYNYMKANSINIIKDRNTYIMHHKVIIIDNRTVITGSYNPTLSANTKNYENIVIITDAGVANSYIAEFNRLFYGKENIA